MTIIFAFLFLFSLTLTVFDCRIGIRQEDITQKFESNLLVMCTRFQDFLM